MSDINIVETTLIDFISELGSDSPAPGGGAAAALSGSMAAALVSMVANLTLGREKYAEFQDAAEKAVDRADALMYELLECINNDMSAFEGVMNALRMPKSNDTEKAKRSQALQESYKAAILAPVETINKCLEAMKLAVKLKGNSNPNVESDLKAAVFLANAGIDAALENVNINLSAINDPEYREQMTSWINDLKCDTLGLLGDMIFEEGE
ncbi:MAG: cyclodeaminase/cyclohydrolase family protein [Synergistaceae bacterium]|nr:cyclodeaminase/cyclohydrolase family protein [Synergistaceae bacterium]